MQAGLHDMQDDLRLKNTTKQKNNKISKDKQQYEQAELLDTFAS